jgi:hypothetical protein
MLDKHSILTHDYRMLATLCQIFFFSKVFDEFLRWLLIPSDTVSQIYLRITNNQGAAF